MKDGVRVSCRGAASAEWLVVAPAVLAVGFGVLQWALLMHGRASVEYAAFQGARAGATSHADPDAIVSGMAVGLVGIRGEEITSVPVSASRAGATALLREELAIGIAAWRQARPTRDATRKGGRCRGWSRSRTTTCAIGAARSGRARGAACWNRISWRSSSSTPGRCGCH